MHCRDVPRPQRANQAVCYPSRLENLSESVRNFQRVHVDACPHIPLSIKSRHADAAGCRHRPRRSQKLVRAYCVQAASDVGLVDGPRGMVLRGGARDGAASGTMARILTAAEAVDSRACAPSLISEAAAAAAAAGAGPPVDGAPRLKKFKDVRSEGTRASLTGRG